VVDIDHMGLLENIIAGRDPQKLSYLPWSLCQMNEESVEIKQRPVEMGDRTTYWTLPPKTAPFQNGVDR
jgi:hypothetical protein